MVIKVEVFVLKCLFVVSIVSEFYQKLKPISDIKSDTRFSIVLLFRPICI